MSSSSIGVLVIGASGAGVLKFGHVPRGYRRITDLSSAVKFPDVPKDATVALVSSEGSIVRYRDDGVSPTKSEGMPISPGSTIVLIGGFDQIEVIETAPGAVLNILYYA